MGNCDIHGTHEGCEGCPECGTCTCEKGEK